MSFKNRLEKLERTPPAHDYTGAREELIRRLERADPETRERVLRAIRRGIERESQDPAR